MKNSVLLVEDDKDLREALYDTLTLAGFNIITANEGAGALEILRKKHFNLIVSDVAMKGIDGHALLKKVKVNYPQVPMLLMTAYADINQAVQAIREGAADYLVKPFEPQVLIKKINDYMTSNEKSQCHVIAEDDKMLKVLNIAKKVAMSDASVLITGESGTGKEVVAQYIHDNSLRKNGPFVAINCAAIPENMLEAILFGYEKGAFTGAYQSSAGKFEKAQDGTILLDEISEMDINLQAKLLRVLQEREVERLGGKKVVSLNVRVLATTNRDLQNAVKEGLFREDLLYRINVFPIKIPRLSERKEDILPLTYSLLEKYARKNNRSLPEIDDEAKQKLLNYNWPGNVRELDNMIQRALILMENNQIKPQCFQFEAAQEPTNSATESLGGDLKLHEHTIILEALQENSGCRKETAKVLGISGRTLRYKIAKMRELGMSIPSISKSENAQ